MVPFVRKVKLIFYFVCGGSGSGGGGGRCGCRWFQIVFLGSGIYYFIVGDILFYCDVYIILLR